MSLRPERYVAVSQIALGLCLFICLLLTPHYFFSLDQGGVSNYGTENRTIGLFTLGFSLAAIGSLLAGIKIPVHGPKQVIMRLGLLLLSALYGLNLLTTYQYKLNSSSKRLHHQAAVALFIGMLLIVIWLRVVCAKDRKAKLAFIVFGIGFLASTVTFFGFLHVLFTAQLICGISFAYMLIRCVSLLDHQQP